MKRVHNNKVYKFLKIEIYKFHRRMAVHFKAQLSLRLIGRDVKVAVKDAFPYSTLSPMVNRFETTGPNDPLILISTQSTETTLIKYEQNILNIFSLFL